MSSETIPGRFAETVERLSRPGAEPHGIWFDGRQYSYTEIDRAAEGVAAWLGARSIGAGDVVALYLPNRMEIPVAHLAAMKWGAVTLPLNPAYTGEELTYLLRDAGARAIVTDRRGAGVVQPLREALPALQEVIVVGETEGAFAAAPELEGTVPFPPPEEAALMRQAATGRTKPSGQSWETPEPGDVAVILYTSGTTGRPKGAQLSHRNVTANLAAVLGAWRIDAGDRFLLTLPLFHAHGLLLGLHGALFSGCQVFLRGRFEAEGVLRELAEHRCTLYMGVPTHYYRFVHSPLLDQVDLSAMRLFTSGSAPLDAHTFRTFRDRTGHAILERYGLSETLFDTGNPYDGERKPGTVGVPFPGVEISIRDADGNKAAPGGEGEVWVRGPNVFRGYLNRPDATHEAMRDGWFRTGDIGRIRPADGYLELLGRAKELIITGGFNVYPREVEEVIARLEGVAECAVLGRPDPEYGECVHAFVVPRPGARVDPAALVEAAREHLARYKVPREIEVVETLPRNAMGKVQKHLLRDRLE